jgi:hypothetical protein
LFARCGQKRVKSKAKALNAKFGKGRREVREVRQRQGFNAEGAEERRRGRQGILGWRSRCPEGMTTRKTTATTKAKANAKAKAKAAAWV